MRARVTRRMRRLLSQSRANTDTSEWYYVTRGAKLHLVTRTISSRLDREACPGEPRAAGTCHPCAGISLELQGDTKWPGRKRRRQKARNHSAHELRRSRQGRLHDARAAQRGAQGKHGQPAAPDAKQRARRLREKGPRAKDPRAKDLHVKARAGKPRRVKLPRPAGRRCGKRGRAEVGASTCASRARSSPGTT
jgi:hypothetical protein